MSGSKPPAQLTQLAEALILSREGLTGQGGSPQDIAQAVDELCKERIRQAFQALADMPHTGDVEELQIFLAKGWGDMS